MNEIITKIYFVHMLFVFQLTSSKLTKILLELICKVI